LLRVSHRRRARACWGVDVDGGPVGLWRDRRGSDAQLLRVAGALALAVHACFVDVQSSIRLGRAVLGDDGHRSGVVDGGGSFARQQSRGSPVTETERQAADFMKSVKLALRYGSGRPLPSLYAMAADQRRAIELTNALLARGLVIETNVIGNRLVLAHRDIVPALWALRTRFRSELTADATRSLRPIAPDV